MNNNGGFPPLSYIVKDTNNKDVKNKKLEKDRFMKSNIVDIKDIIINQNLKKNSFITNEKQTLNTIDSIN
jgi:hypothetical protein